MNHSFFLAFDRNTGIVVDGRTIYSEPGMIMAIEPDAANHELMRDDPPRYVAIFIDREQFEAQLIQYGLSDVHEVLPGDSWCIPGNVLHSAEIIKESVAVEVFSPV